MKTIVATFAWTASLAMASGPADFAAQAPLATTGNAALYRVALPEAVYRHARPDLADVRIFNARGEAVPIALAREPEASRETLPSVELPAFALTSLEPAAIASQVTVRLSNGTLVAVTGKRPPATTERRIAGYILDASALERPIHALNLDWDAPRGQEIVRVRVEGSDDLRTWHPVAGPVSLVRMEQAGRRLEQPRVPLNDVRDKYLRVNALELPFALKGVRAEFAERVLPAERAVKRVDGKPGAKAGEAAYDLAARLPVEAVRLVPADANSVIPATLFVRDGPDGAPTWVAQATFYRLLREGVDIESPATTIPRRTARYWIARADPDKGGFGSALPQLEVQWRPAQVVFVARGDGPFTLAFGRRETNSALLPVASMIPGYEPHAEMKLPEASVGAIAGSALAPSAWPPWLEDIPPRKLALWAVLVGAVAILAFMAWRLHRTVR